jgi:type II secretory pathway component GspD/PulD (secretin)
VPFLSKIPILSWFFSNSAESDRNNELVIFITPHIVVPENDLRPASEAALGG